MDFVTGDNIDKHWKQESVLRHLYIWSLKKKCLRFRSRKKKEYESRNSSMTENSNITWGWSHKGQRAPDQGRPIEIGPRAQRSTIIQFKSFCITIVFFFFLSWRETFRSPWHWRMNKFHWMFSTKKKKNFLCWKETWIIEEESSTLTKNFYLAIGFVARRIKL